VTAREPEPPAEGSRDRPVFRRRSTIVLLVLVVGSGLLLIPGFLIHARDPAYQASTRRVACPADAEQPVCYQVRIRNTGEGIGAPRCELRVPGAQPVTVLQDVVLEPDELVTVTVDVPGPEPAGGAAPSVVCD
jgi:hypothetical protein